MPSGQPPADSATGAATSAAGSVRGTAAVTNPAGGPGAAGQASGKALGQAGAPAKPKVGKVRRAIHAFGVYGIWALPIFALASALARRSPAAFSLDPRVYANYAHTGRYEPRELVVTIGVAALGVLSILAVGALLAQGRARRLALAGFICAGLGAAAMLWQASTLLVRADRVRDDLLSGHFDRIAWNAVDRGGLAVTLVLGGAALLIIGWILYGVATLRTHGLNRMDGVLLIVSAPLLYGGGLILNMLPVLGSFLLLAAGLGIGRSAMRARRAATLDEVFGPRAPRRSGEYAHMEDLGLIPAPAMAPTGPDGHAGDGPDGDGRTHDNVKAPRRRFGSTAWTVTRAKADADPAATSNGTSPGVHGRPNGAGAGSQKPERAGADQPDSVGQPDSERGKHREVGRDADVVAAPPPAAPAAAKNLKPILTWRTSRNAGDAGASLKNGANIKSGNAPPGAATNANNAKRRGRNGDRNSGPA